MYNYSLSLIAGFIGMVWAVSSYFVKNKKLFLVCQGLALVFLALSCLFIEQYFAVLSYLVSVVRVIIYYLIERADKKQPFWLQTLFAMLVVASYVIINIVILENHNLLDIIFLIGGVMYAYVFCIKNMMLMRYVFIIPTVLTIIYYLLIQATLFVIMSYTFELLANIFAIIIYSIYNKKAKQAMQNQNQKK